MADAPFGPLDAAADAVDRDLEIRLRDLGRHVRFPVTPDLAGSTRRLLSKDGGAEPARREAPVRSWWPRLAMAAVVLVVTISGMFALSSTARDTVAGWIDIPGVDLLSSDDEEPAGETPVSVRAWLGDAASLETIAAEAPFVVLLPVDAQLGRPDETYLLPEGETVVVSALYVAGDSLPALGGSDVGLLIMQFPAGPDSVWLQKELGAGTSMEIVRVNGGDALWIEGAHDLRAIPEDGRTPEARPSGNVLLWNSGGITYRIEANLPRQSMIGIAESMEPLTT